MTDIVLQWKCTRGMQVVIAIGNGDKYYITAVDTHGLQLGFVLVL